jgi:hypothetical protein
MTCTFWLGGITPTGMVRRKILLGCGGSVDVDVLVGVPVGLSVGGPGVNVVGVRVEVVVSGAV